MATDDLQTYDSAAEAPRRFPWLAVIVALCLFALGVFLWQLQQRAQQRADVTAAVGRLTLEQDDGGNMATIDRTKGEELWYRVTLENAPVGVVLALTCDWLDPSGQVVHQNHYKTRAIGDPVWVTHARYRLGPQSPLGNWTVKLLLDGRELHSLQFEARDKLPSPKLWDGLDVKVPPKNAPERK